MCGSGSLYFTGYLTGRQNLISTLYCGHKPKEGALLSQANTPNVGYPIEPQNGHPLVSLMKTLHLHLTYMKSVSEPFEFSFIHHRNHHGTIRCADSRANPNPKAANFSLNHILQSLPSKPPPFLSLTFRKSHIRIPWHATMELEHEARPRPIATAN